MLYIRMATLCMKNIEQTQKIQEGKTKKKTNPRINYKERELMKEGRESLVVSPQVRDQLKKVPLKEASI